MRIRRSSLIAALTVAIGSGCGHEDTASACGGSVPPDVTRHISVPARALDVAVHATGYILGTSRGVMRVDPCSFSAVFVCSDRGGVSELALDGDLAQYRRLDGSLGACDLALGSRASPSTGAAARIAASRSVRSALVQAALEDTRVTLRPRGELTRTLRTSGDPLGLALSPSGHELAVADASGAVTFFTVPGGLQRARWNALESNAYAVAYDAERARVLAVGGEGVLSIRRRSP